MFPFFSSHLFSQLIALSPAFMNPQRPLQQITPRISEMLLLMNNFYLIIFLHFLWSIDYFRTVFTFLTLMKSHSPGYLYISLMISSIMSLWVLFLFSHSNISAIQRTCCYSECHLCYTQYTSKSACGPLLHFNYHVHAFQIIVISLV